MVDERETAVPSSHSENDTKVTEAKQARQEPNLSESETSDEPASDSETSYRSLRVSETSEGNETANVVDEATASTTMAKPSKLEFTLGEDDWETYIERLELYFIANDIKDAKKTAVLLARISTDAYCLVRDLCAPVKPKDKTFVELVKTVTDHLCPKPSETMERCKYHLAKQSELETVAEFSARLKK